MTAARTKGRDAATQGALLVPSNAACPSGQIGLWMIIAVTFLRIGEAEILHRLWLVYEAYSLRGPGAGVQAPPAAAEALGSAIRPDALAGFSE
jgi:hypothetical protein